MSAWAAHIFRTTQKLKTICSEGKLEALAILLQKLRSENRRVLIFTQMVKMLDILEAFLDHRQLTYIRVDESLTTEERQVKHLCTKEVIRCTSYGACVIVSSHTETSIVLHD